jgi:DNA polymerase III gamma/tau subunit
MQSYIISGKDLEKGRGEAEKLATEEKVNKFDLTVLPQFEKDLGIEDVRNIQKNIYLTPAHGNKKALILILQKGATIEAQNSMLKLLEEPPPSSLIYIVVGSYRIFLPTILSRIKLIEFSDKSQSGNEGLEEILHIKTPEDALEIASNLSKDKDQAIIWLEGTILAARDRMIEKVKEPEALKLRKIIHNLEVTHYDLKNTNTNTRLALENLFLSLG